MWILKLLWIVIIDLGLAKRKRMAMGLGVVIDW